MPNNGARPKVSIGLPVYNGENYLRQAAESLLAQSLHDFELIICDNASADATQDICREFSARDSRIRYYRNETNVGAAPNFNRVVELARAPYFKWAAHDDVCAPELLERCVAALDTDPSIVMCYSRSGRIGDDGRLMESVDYPMRVDSPRAHIRFHDLVWTHHDCTAVFGVMRTDVLRRTPMIASYVGSDRNLLAELSLHGWFVELPERLFFQRQHAMRSLRTHRNERERLEWFDPAKARSGISMPKWKCIQEYARAITRAPLNADDRLRCRLTLFRFAHYRQRELWTDMTQATRAWAIKHKLVRDDEPSWEQCVNLVKATIANVIPPNRRFILLDQGTLGITDIPDGRRAVPFPERNGIYWGKPKDDQCAINELERLRKNGAEFLVVAWPAFWWLDHLAEFNAYLKSHSRCVTNNRWVLVFNLQPHVVI